MTDTLLTCDSDGEAETESISTDEDKGFNIDVVAVGMSKLSNPTGSLGGQEHLLG